MSPLWTILQVKLRIGRHTVASVRDESRLKVAVVSVSAFALWFGALAAFLEGFGWLQGFDRSGGAEFLSLGDILMVRLLAVFGLSLFFMLVFSNILVCYSTAYRSKEVAYFLHTPITIRTLFFVRFVECVIFSSWASAYLGSPLILGYGLVTGAPIVFYVAALVFFVPFVMIPAALGSLITLFLVRALPRLPRGSIPIGTAALVGGVFLYIRGTFSAEKLSEETLIPFLVEATGRTQAPFLPSHWVAQGMLAAAELQYGECLFYLGLTIANALMFTWLAIESAALVYYPGWSALIGQDRVRLRPLGKGILGRLDHVLSPVRNPLRSLIVKDIKLFWRDPTQWAQFVVFFGVMAIYIANLRNRSFGYHSAAYKSWVSCLNIGACTLILATLTSRFVFPLVSLEGARFWILGLAPITMRQIVWQKFWLSVWSTGPFSVGLVILSCSMLEVDAVRFALSVYSICLANLALAGLAVGLGSLYPNFQEDNPARIVSGMGGTLNFLCSVFYIVLVVGAQTLILQWHVLEKYTNPGGFLQALAGVLLFVTVLSIAATLAPMRLGLRHLNRAEF